jgi:hypothetical protein
VTKLTDGEGSVRTHVATMAFYEGSNENNDLPATFMAANYDWTEQASNSAGAQAATAFHAAGGLHAMAYMDPNAINCSSNQPGSCSDLETRLDNMDETGYLHNQDGSRAYSNGQQRINTLSTAFLTAWPLQVQDFLALSPAWTAAQRGTVEIDTENWVTLAMFAYDGGPFQEITQQPQVTQAQSGVPGYTPNLAVLNGVDYDFPADGYYDQLLDALGTAITGEFNENAFAITYGSGYMTNSYPTTNAWKNQENGILDVVGRKLHDFVWMEGDPSPAHRMYGVASYWLTRRARLSVLWEDFCAPDNTPKGYCNSTWADITVVPRDPLQTATGGSIDTLAVGPLYRREFGACFQVGGADRAMRHRRQPHVLVGAVAGPLADLWAHARPEHHVPVRRGHPVVGERRPEFSAAEQRRNRRSVAGRLSLLAAGRDRGALGRRGSPKAPP